MKTARDNATERATAPDDERAGLCSARGCPLAGTVGRGGQWWCYCHAEADTGKADVATRIVRSHRAVYAATLDVRAHHAAHEWPRIYRAGQERLLEVGRDDLLPGQCDESQYRPGRPFLSQWLARLERFLFDATCEGLRSAPNGKAGETHAARHAPLRASRECLVRMRATLAPLARREPSVRWAFDLLDRIAARPVNTLSPDSMRIALDAICSPSGRTHVAEATDAQRARWRVALELIGGSAAAAMTSRTPGEDDETFESEVQHDPV